MDFQEETASLANDPKLHRLAMRYAGSRELAEDALQETYWTVSRVKDPESVVDRRAFFCRSLINEINRQRARPLPILVEDVATTAGLPQEGASSSGAPPTSVENEAGFRILAERMLGQLERDQDRLMDSVPPRSDDHRRYQIAIVRATRRILHLLLQGYVTSADWNAVLRFEGPHFCDEPGLTADAIHQRLSRARSDVRSLLQTLISRDELTA